MTEIEIKLSLQPDLAPVLRRHALMKGMKPVTRRLHSIYLDTPGWDLVERRVALRVRRAGRQWLQTLKVESASIGALTSRGEWEVALPRGHHDLARFPEDARARLEDMATEGVDLGHVAPAFVTDFRRTAWQVKLGGARMELALDEGVIQVGADTIPLCEVEIELKEGPSEALFDLALALLDQVPMGLEPRSKAARGYALAGAVRPGPMKAAVMELDRKADAASAWAQLAGDALAQAVANIPGFLANPEEIEYLHQLRVGLRRLRSIAQVPPGQDSARPMWDDDLKQALASLNVARDWDVLMHDTLPPLVAKLAPPPAPSLRKRLAREASIARLAAQGVVADPAFTRLVLLVGKDLVQVGMTGHSARSWAAECLESHWQALHKRGKGFIRQNARQRHRLRMAVKRMRYSAEMFSTLFKGGKGFRAELEKLQDRLGMGQDAVVAMQFLQGLSTRSPRIRQDLARIVHLLAKNGKGRKRGGKSWQSLRKAKPYWQRALKTR